MFCYLEVHSYGLICPVPVDVMICDCSEAFSVKGEKKEQNQVRSTQQSQVQSFLGGPSGQYLLSMRPLHPCFGTVLISLLVLI